MLETHVKKLMAAIHELSDIRAQYSVFDPEERLKYNACSLGIDALRKAIDEVSDA